MPYGRSVGKVALGIQAHECAGGGGSDGRFRPSASKAFVAGTRLCLQHAQHDSGRSGKRCRMGKPHRQGPGPDPGGTPHVKGGERATVPILEGPQAAIRRGLGDIGTLGASDPLGSHAMDGPMIGARFCPVGGWTASRRRLSALNGMLLDSPAHVGLHRRRDVRGPTGRPRRLIRRCYANVFPFATSRTRPARSERGRSYGKVGYDVKTSGIAVENRQIRWDRSERPMGLIGTYPKRANP
ncbi:hypothetical protein ABID43_004636 [Methylobacterium goesingense]|uniref:Uncharacterized protein n=1 Tax=Methylobacterium goesingense TaxID=243690 RepID=A0ABV2LE88_9HYPH